MKLSLQICLLFLFSFLSACGQKPYNQQMIETANKVLLSIKEQSEEQFSRIIGVELKVIGKNEEMLHNDFMNLTNYYKNYSSAQTLTPVIIDTPNELGQKSVQITLKKGNGNSTLGEEVKLFLYFGPPNLSSLDKITGYKIETNNNAFQNNPIIAPPPIKSHG